MIEATLLLALFAWTGSRPSVRALLADAPLVYRLFAVGLASAMLAGQLAHDARATYPLVTWGMYTHRIEGAPEYHRLLIVGSDGRESDVPIETLFSGANTQLRVRVARLAQAAARLPDGPERRRALDTFETILVTIFRRYRERNPEVEIRELRYLRCTVAVRFAHVGPPACEQLFSLEAEQP